jgi:hypothetical protein
MRLAALLIALTAVAPTPTPRDQNVSLPVRERIIPRNFEIRLPAHPCAVPSTIQFLAGSVEAVSGTEFIAGPCDFRTSRPEPTDAINLLGLTVEDALNLLVKIDSRYEWHEGD